jgi:competence protein ComEA
MKKLCVALVLFSAQVLATPVNVNTADAQTLANSLAGVGLKKAEAIVADRTKNGPFKSPEELKRVLGIGDKIISVNKNDILVSDVKGSVTTVAKPTAASPTTTPVASPAAPVVTPPAPVTPAKPMTK